MHNLFEKLEFTRNETAVYLCLAEMGKASASLVAKKLELPRSTIYSVLENLGKRGVVSMDQASGNSYYSASQPAALARMVEREKDELLRQVTSKEAAAKELQDLVGPFFKSQNYSVPKLQFYDGTANVENMLYELCFDWQKSLANYDHTWWGYQDHHFVETYREWLDYYWARMYPEEKIMLLSNRSETEKKLKGKVSRRTIKIIPKTLEFSSTIWVLGDYVVTIMTRQKPHYAFQLKDAVFASNQRLMFQQFWGLLK